jgi:mannitol 2-dehydrogenase
VPTRPRNTGAVIPSLAPIPYDRSTVQVGIVHFGVGNFHRSHQAMYIDRLLRQGDALEWGICGVGVLPSDARMRDTLRAQALEYTLVERGTGGSRPATRIGSRHRVPLACADKRSGRG